MALTDKKESFGGAIIARLNPVDGPYPKAINVTLSFEEMLKLKMAIDEGCRKLNKYNRTSKEAKSRGLKFVIKTDSLGIDVFESKV